MHGDEDAAQVRHILLAGQSEPLGINQLSQNTVVVPVKHNRAPSARSNIPHPSCFTDKWHTFQLPQQLTLYLPLTLWHQH